MTAHELLEKVKAGKSIPCDVTGKPISADEILKIAFKKGEIFPLMENAVVSSIVSVEAQQADELIKVSPRGPDIKFRQG